MMINRVLVTTLAVLATAVPAASAGTIELDNAWFSLVDPGNCEPYEVLEGPGRELVIRRWGASDCTMTLGYNITANALEDYGVDGLLSWGIELQANNLDHGHSVGISNGVFGPGYETSILGDDTPNLVTQQHRAGNLANASGPDGLVYTFDLTTTSVSTHNSTTLIYGDFLDGVETLYGPPITFSWAGFVGPNPFSYGIHNYTGKGDVTPGWGELPVIQINNFVPEPHVAALFLIVAVGALCKRRAQTRAHAQVFG